MLCIGQMEPFQPVPSASKANCRAFLVCWAGFSNYRRTQTAASMTTLWDATDPAYIRMPPLRVFLGHRTLLPKLADQFPYHSKHARDEEPNNDAHQDNAKHWDGNAVPYSHPLSSTALSSPLCNNQLNYSHVTHLPCPTNS